MMQFKIKLSLIKQILNADVNIYWLATSPPKLMIFGFFEVIKCNSSKQYFRALKKRLASFGIVLPSFEEISAYVKVLD